IRDGQDAAKTPRRFTTADGLASDQIRALHEDDDGAVWIGTFGGGLNVYRNGAFTRFTARDGLLSDNVSHVEDDGKGALWLSTTRGICRVQKQQLRDFAAGRIHILTPANYGVADGLRSAQCAPGYPAGGGGTITSDGRLWFPTSRGLAVLQPSAPEPKASPPIVQLVEVTADGRDLDVGHSAKMNPGTGHFQFHYTAIHLSAPERVRYSYKLEGLDRGWISAGSRRRINYNSLAEGHYRFLVCATLDGRTSSDTSFAFEVLPRFYERAWFRWLCAATLAAFIYGAYQLRLKQLRGRFSLVLEERARLAREIHDTLAQGFVGISSQLEAVAVRLNGDPAVAWQHLELARKMARHSLTEARRSVMDLRASSLENRDLPSALSSAARQWGAGSAVPIAIDISGEPRKLPEDVEQNVLRIAQEAVTNALKHSGAHAIGVHLAMEARRLLLRVSDDGRGFEPARVFSALDGHFGILGMRERAERLGGELDLSSVPGGGTQVEVRVPLA
ncbi:MAG: histidine kinase, partial [Bryobacteraceae bacterium]